MRTDLCIGATTCRCRRSREQDQIRRSVHGICLPEDIHPDRFVRTEYPSDEVLCLIQPFELWILLGWDLLRSLRLTEQVFEATEISAPTTASAKEQDEQHANDPETAHTGTHRSSWRAPPVFDVVARFEFSPAQSHPLFRYDLDTVTAERFPSGSRRAVR